MSTGLPDEILAKANAATTAGSNTYCYDRNGNMVRRTVRGTTYTLTYDAEDRLVNVTGGGITATFVYDGNGVRVKATTGATTTVFAGSGVTNYECRDGVGGDAWRLTRASLTIQEMSRGRTLRFCKARTPVYNDPATLQAKFCLYNYDKLHVGLHVLITEHDQQDDDDRMLELWLR